MIWYYINYIISYRTASSPRRFHGVERSNFYRNGLAQPVDLLACIRKATGKISAGTRTIQTVDICSFPQSLHADAYILPKIMTSEIRYPVI
jgi:hypothetical protein